MTIEALRARLPEHAKDLKLNLASLAAEAALTPQQRAGTFVASALATRNRAVADAAVAEFGAGLAPAALAAARAAAAIMAMNNVYYRFTHLVSDAQYRTMPARLRMNAMAKPGVEKADFELWCLAVSAINGCGMCMDSHEQALRREGVGAEAIQAAVRIAATLSAVASVLDCEPEPLPAAA